MIYLKTVECEFLPVAIQWYLTLITPGLPGHAQDACLYAAVAGAMTKFESSSR